MYVTQDQRLRSNAEREQLVELFSYAVGIFDFEPDPDLRKFVQVRGAVQLYGYFVEIYGKALNQLIVKEQITSAEYKALSRSKDSLTDYMVRALETLRK